MRRRAIFLIVSNMRSGSTWLVATLGSLPDAATDYEIKWKINYQPQRVHYVLHDASPALSTILDAMGGTSPVFGSKFVFDPDELARADYAQLRTKFDRDLRIVHLVRRYRDIFLSARRGFVHQLNDGVRRPIGPHLMAGFEASRPSDTPPPGPTRIAPVACYEELRTYLQNDVWTWGLRSLGCPYLLVSYERLGEHLPAIADFIGSEAKPDVVADLIERPVTVKLPEQAPAEVIANIAELDPLFEQFERLRSTLLGDDIAAEYGAPTAGGPAPLRR